METYLFVQLGYVLASYREPKGSYDKDLLEIGMKLCVALGVGCEEVIARPVPAAACRRAAPSREGCCLAPLSSKMPNDQKAQK